MARSDSERLQACAILVPILRNEGSLSQAFGSGWQPHPDSSPALIQELCYGVCRWYQRLEFFAQQLLEKPLRAKDNDVRCLILIGLYQLLYMRIPAHAAIHQTVEDVVQLGKPWAKGLINAVLREAQRQQVELLTRAERDYATWYSHPEWLLTQLKRDWPAHYRAILEANNTRAPMTLRVNHQKISRAGYAALLQEHKRPARESTIAPYALLLAAPCDVSLLPGFDEGLVSVQDEASQLIAEILPLAPGLRVLDACAAPGGKSSALLEAEPTLRILALDREERRLTRMRDNLARLGQQADVRCGDITVDSFAIDSFDRILLDVPCSATGVIRRHPDIKLLRSAAEVAALCNIQHALLRAAWPVLAPGGYLLYSTCSALADENQRQIQRFLAEHPAAQLQPLAQIGAVPGACGLQLLPTPDGPDGFFYALLRKS
ncbi:MAG: ribosomal small subunit methyltransferase [Pseudomonadota bacterium]